MTEFTIESIRGEIDALDRQIVQLIAQRQKWVVEAGKLKTDRTAVQAPDRVEKVIAKVRGLATEFEADPEVVERSYRSMIAAFIDIELSVHLKHQGEEMLSS
ncbi:chorismate mutase [Psychromicrobium sp. YIM B11713]|uniref:chorismate mutase n=1 Tax=Psychromicrobium sp. YIM B11713 TaxID=3145233 RepID=UPI00374EEF9F